MTLQELRFFSVYLAKINSRDIESRKVRFSIVNFQKIMELGLMKMSYIKNVTNNLLCKIVTLVKPSGGYSSFQLFKKCDVDVDANGDWYVEIDAHDDALPLMFKFKKRYFTYQLWNALKLKSSNQLRMYEILKQYEYIDRQENIAATVDDEISSQDEQSYFSATIYPLMAEACNNEFQQNEIQVLYNLTTKIIPYQTDRNRLTEMYDYLKRKYDELKWRATRSRINGRFGYLKKLSRLI